MKIRAHIIALIGILAISTFVVPEFADGQATVKRDTKKAKQLREQADKSYRQKNYRDAIDKYAESITFDPANADAREFVTTFGLHAFRRPLKDAEVERYVDLFNGAAAAYPIVGTRGPPPAT